MNNKEIAKVLEETSILLELRGENRFKSNAYRNAGRVIEGLEEDLGSLVERGKLREIRGVGEALAEQLTTLVQTGALPYLEELRASIPDGLLEFLRIPGLGPRKAKALHEGLGFEPVGVFRRVGFKLGQWRDVGWWQLALGEPAQTPVEPRPFPAVAAGLSLPERRSVQFRHPVRGHEPNVE